MAFHSNQPAQRSNMIFPNRNQGISHCPELGQNLNPIGGFNPLGTLDSFGPRQFDANEFDNRAYLNSSDPWKSGSTLLQQEQGDSSNLQCSLLSSVPTDLNGIQSISNSASGFSSQALRIMPQSAGELPYFHQSPLVSVSQQQYSAYQNLPTSNNQSQAISTAHIVSQSPTASFIRRYPDNTNAIGGIDPTSLSSGMGYTNQDYSGELVSLVNFSRNNLTSYVVNDNTMTNSLLAAKTSGTSRNVEDNSQLMFNSIQNGEGEVSASSQGIDPRRSPQNLILTQPAHLSQYPSETIAPIQISGSLTKASHDKSVMSPNTKAQGNTEEAGIRTPKSSSKALDSAQSPTLTLNTTPAGQKLKRPMNAFLIYASERRPQLQQADPTMTTAAQSKILGDEWAKMEEPQKQAYVERARALKSQFLETNPDYVYTRRPNNTKKKYRRRSTGEGDVGSPKLKRPMNAYLLFNKEMRHKLLETNPNMSVAEISKEIGDRWKNLNEEERNRYFTEAQTIKRDFLVTNPDFVYTRRSKAEIEARKKRGMEEEDAALTRDPRGRKKKKQKNPTAPKHPMSGFLFYLAAVRPQVAEQYPGSTVGPISKIIASQWNSMSPEKRLPWEQKASEDKARYAREMEEYLADRQ